MNNCLNCGCIEEHSDKCILYTGPDIEAVNIKYGQRYDAVTVALAEKLVEIIEQTADLKCLYTGSCSTCSPTVSIPEAVQVVIDKLCSLTAADVTYEGQLFCLGNDSISVDAVNLLGRSYTYFVAPTSTNCSVGFDISGAMSGLPSGYVIGKTKVTLSGKKKNGKTVIADSSTPTSAFIVDYDRFPLVLDIQMRVNSPNGTVDLVDTLTISAPVSQAAGKSLAVKDYGQSGSVITQDMVNTLLAAQTCSNKTDIEQLRNLQIASCEELEYPNPDIKSVVSVQAAALCDLIARLKDLEVVSFRECSADCNDTTKDKPIGEVIQTMADTICEIREDIELIKTALKELDAQVAACCGVELTSPLFG